MAASLTVESIPPRCVAILGDTSCYSLGSESIPPAPGIHHRVIYLKQTQVFRGMHVRCICHVCMCEYACVTVYVCVCVCGGVTFQQLACPGPCSECEESSAPKGCESAFVRLFYFFSRINVGQPWSLNPRFHVLDGNSY